MQVPHLPEMPVVSGEISQTSLCEGDHKNGSSMDGVGDDRGKMTLAMIPSSLEVQKHRTGPG